MRSMGSQDVPQRLRSTTRSLALLPDRFEKGRPVVRLRRRWPELQLSADPGLVRKVLQLRAQWGVHGGLSAVAAK